MELMPGFRHRGVGAIPDEWEVFTIGQLIENKSILGHLDGNHGALYPRSSEFKQHGVPYIGATDFADGVVDFRECKFLSEDRAAQFQKGVAKDGDVLFAHNATVGPVALLRTSENFVILSTTATYFRCNYQKLSNLYLFYALQSPHFVTQYEGVMAQSTRFQVPITAQRKLSLVIPPLPEQRAISAALGAMDALISGLDQLIAKKRAVKQATMQQLLTGKTRLPGFEGDWERKVIGDLFCFLSTANNPRNDLSTDGAIEYIHYGDIHTRWKSFLDCEMTMLPRICEEKVRNVSFLEDGDLVMVDASEDYAGVGVSVEIMNIEGRRIVAGLHTLLLRGDKDKLANGFKGYLQYMPEFKDALIRVATGVSVYGLLRRNIENLSILLPQVVEQKAIAQILSDMNAEIAALEQKRDKTRLLKQGMMQELLTGRIRLV